MGFQIVDDPVIETDLTSVHTVKSRDHTQKGGLSASGRPKRVKNSPGLISRSTPFNAVNSPYFYGIFYDHCMTHIHSSILF